MKHLLAGLLACFLASLQADCADKIYNTALLVGRQGEIVGRYSKTRLQKHDLRFAPGDDLPVFETPWANWAC